jgi:hypothetical protein
MRVPPDKMWYATPQTASLLWARRWLGLHVVVLAERLLGLELWPMDETLKAYYRHYGFPTRGARTLPHERGIPSRETDPHGWRG